MKRIMIAEKWKTKTIAMLMAGVMVFAMAPLGTGVAFADEENNEPAEVTVDIPEETADVPEEPAEGAAGIELKGGKLKSLGIYTMNLSEGTKTVELYFSEYQTSEMVIVQSIVLGGMMSSDKVLFVEQDEETGTFYLDLDEQGESFDVRVTPESTSGDPSEGLDMVALCFEKMSTCNIKGSYTVMLSPEELSMYESFDGEIPAGFEGYYSGMKFIFGKTANTLAVKGKTVKIKAKKLKKKAKTYGISKFLTVSKAQGTVTYAKVSGNKKIKIASNGKVTLKKKLKKGKYKVKVNVTAAGNDSYSKATKAVVFTVKVK